MRLHLFSQIMRQTFSSPPLQIFGNVFSDNDSLASLVAVETGADVCLLLTDVNGVFDKPPGR